MIQRFLLVLLFVLANLVGFGADLSVANNTTVEITGKQVYDHVQIDGTLTVTDTLIVNGDLDMGNNGVLNTGANSVIVVFGNANLRNKTNINLSSYFIVMGNLSDVSAAGKVTVTADGAKIYVIGTISNLGGKIDKCEDIPYDGGTSSGDITSDTECDAGGYGDLIGNVDPDDLPDGVYEQITGTVNQVSPTSQTVCAGSLAADISLTRQTGTLVKWQKSSDVDFTSPADISVTSSTLSGTDIGAISSTIWIRAVLQSGSAPQVTSNVAVIRMDTTEPEITDCPASTSVSCISEIPAVADMTDFTAQGGAATDNCTATASLSVATNDVISTSPCRVIRTYTVADASGNFATCSQTYNITDSSKPIINNNLPLDEIVLEPDANGGCVGNTTVISEPTASDNCGFGDVEAAFSYRLGDEPTNPIIAGTGGITATFPVGTTTISWTIADECGHVSDPASQQVVVEFPITPITYDDGSTSVETGSGVKPMLTSTHTYQIDGGTAQSGYTYEWLMFADVNADGIIDDTNSPVSTGFTMSPDAMSAEVAITFTGLIAEEAYILVCRKSNDLSGCSGQQQLKLKIRENTFDTGVNGESSLCQMGETNTATPIVWTVTFPNVETEPFQFDYTITMDGAGVCNGTVSDISYASTSLTHTSGCLPSGSPATPPFIQVEKNANAHVVKVTYTIANATATDFDFELDVVATDKFSVSDAEPDNNVFNSAAHGVPNTSEIQID